MSVVRCTLVLMLLVAAVLSDYDQSKTRNSIEKKLLAFIEDWRSGSSDLLPNIEVIQLPSAEGTYNEDGVKLSYTTSEMTLTGLNEFIIQDLSASLEYLNASLSVLIPSLTISAEHYELSGRAYFFYPLKGSGKLTFELYDSILSAAVKLTSKDTGTRMEDIQLQYNVGDFKADLAGSSWPINSVLNKEGLKILRKYHDHLVSTAQEYVLHITNDYLVTLPIEDLLTPLL